MTDEHADRQLPLFADLPTHIAPLSETSQEWHDLCLLRAIEGIRFDQERLAAYIVRDGDVGFLDFVLNRLGGRSQ